MAPRILILAGDTDDNLGDLAILSATCDYLRRLCPGVELCAVTDRPQRDRERLGIRPIRRGWRGLPTLIAAARRADLVICGGGGLFQDDDSLLKMPYWALRLAFVKIFCRRLAGLSIGAGPLDHATSRVFARLALRMLDPITVRDMSARAVLSPLTHRPVDVVPDPAFLLTSAPREESRRVLRGAGVPLDGTPLVGVAVRRWFHTDSNVIPNKYLHKLGLSRRRGQSPMAVFVERAAASLDRVAGRTGAHIVFLPTYNVGHEDDAAVCRRIAASMRTAPHAVIELDDPKCYRTLTGMMSVMLCGRMHPAILAAGEGTPVVGLSYNPKFAGMFSLLGYADRCLPLGDFVHEDQTERLVDMLLAAIDEPHELRPRTEALQQATRQAIERLVTPLAGDLAVVVAGQMSR